MTPTQSQTPAAQRADNVAPPAASEVVAACERAWREIQHHHPGVPDVVVVLGTGVERGRLVKLGHWWGGRWIAEGAIRGEVLLAGEALHLTPSQVFEVLLHEAAHGLNTARGVKDSSRGGRYHNARFKATAEEVGLTVSMMSPYGWARTSLGPSLAARYESEIAQLGEAMRIARRLGADVRLGEPGVDDRDAHDQHGRQGTTRAKSGAATCGCGRRMRMAPSVFAQGPVLCGVCGQDFTIQHAPQRHAAHAQAADPAFEPPVPQPVESPQVTPIQQRALESLTRLASTPQGMAVLAEAAAWCQTQHDTDPYVLNASSVAETQAMNEAVRALLIVNGTLTEPIAQIGESDFLVGEQVMIREHDASATDVEGDQLPPPGVFGTVTSIDLMGRYVDVDFPIIGHHRIHMDDAGARVFTYGYVEPPCFAAELIDLRELRDAPSSPEPIAAPGVEMSW